MTSLIDKALSCVGLMRVAEHGAMALKSAADDQLIAQLTRTSRRLHMLVECRDAEIADLTPDALLWRNARDKRAGKRGKANG